MDLSDRLGPFRIALILGLISAIVSVVPGSGKIAWYVGVPVAALVLILAIVTIIKGRFGYGMILIVCACLIPLWCLAAPFISTGKLARLIHGLPLEDPPPAAEQTIVVKSPAPKGAKGKKPRPEPPDEVTFFSAEPIAEKPPMFEMREWTSADGRKMRAELKEVFKNDDGLFTGRFIRDDGKAFELPVGKLSPGDLEEVKKAMGAE